MCGLVGFVDYKKLTDVSSIVQMTEALHHRGPDSSSNSFYRASDYHVALGHKRLSILDLSVKGSQPMIYKHLEIVYNGEVYNFNEIKTDLIKLGYKFNSKTDTEVIIKAFHKWGIHFVNRLNGMFSISIYDKKADKIYAFRDRAGVKPFYWYYDNRVFLFSSELKSFHKNPLFIKKIKKSSLESFFKYGYISAPYTIFQNTYKLRAGHYIEFNLKSKKITEKKYWDILDHYNKTKLNLSEEKIIDELEKILISSFKYRLIADVPVGVFLSGGYDSSLLTAILQKHSKEKIKTFTIGFNESGYDESKDARLIAEHLNTNHTEYICTQKDALDIIPELPYFFDEPFGDPSAIPTILVSKIAKRDVTVVLSADGGDEIFAGYTKYSRALKQKDYFSKIPYIIKKLISFIIQNINLKKGLFLKKIKNIETRLNKLKLMLLSDNVIDYMKIMSQIFTQTEIDVLINSNKHNKISNSTAFLDNKKTENISDLEKMMAYDFQKYMVDDVLVKVDRSTMSVSLEGREPLLDYRIIEYAASVKSYLKAKNKTSKWLLRKIAHKYIPKKLIERKKKGFAVPLTYWFKDDLENYLSKYLNRERLEKNKILNIDKVIQIKNNFLNGGRENINKLWLILVFEMWYEKWMK